MMYEVPRSQICVPPVRTFGVPCFSVSTWPLAIARCGDRQTATFVLPKRAATAVLTDAFFQLGAPLTRRPWTAKPDVLCNKSKSPVAWKSYFRPLSVLMCVSPTEVDAAHAESVPGLLSL